MSMNRKQILFAWIGGAIPLIALLLASFWTFRQIEDTAAMRMHTNGVLKNAIDLLSRFKDAETGERGYLLTGDDTFLEPYTAASRSIKTHLEELRQMTATNSASRKHLDALPRLIDASLTNMAHNIELRRNLNIAAAVEDIKGGQGKRLMDSIRDEMGRFILTEEQTLAQREAAFQLNMRLLFCIIIIASMVTLLFALLFVYFIRRENQHRIKNLVHIETQRLLEIQENTNRQLQQTLTTLQISEEKFSVTLNSIGDGVIATDAMGRVTLLNPLAEELTGWTHTEALGRPIDEVFHIINQETREPSTIPVKETLANGTTHGLANHTVLISRSGMERVIADSCAPIRDRDGLVIGAVLVFRDVTERDHATEALMKAEALQSAIFNSANFSSIATDARGVIQIFNVGAERMLGYAAADVMNKITPADISDPRELTIRARSLSIEFGTPITPGFEALIFKASRGIEDIYELTYIRKDASRFPAVVSVTALRDAQDQVIGYLLIGTDNSARKKAEEALLKAGSLQTAIFNSANFSSIATDAKGVIQIFNVGAERMLGYEPADVMNKLTPADISDPHEVIARAKALSAELGAQITPGFEALIFKASRGIEDIYELTYIRKDGSRFPAVVSVTALRDPQDDIIGYLLIGTDNTARKQIEADQKLLAQRLRDHQFYTRSLFESNIDALITTDPSGIITDVNKQMEDLTDCTRDELIGAPFKSYFTDPERAAAGITLVLSGKRITDYELTAHARDGKETVVSYNATTFYDRDRRLQGVFAAARDVTERKRLDKVLKENNIELESAKSIAEEAKDSAEIANRAKSTFLANMSHELRTPLNSINGFSEVLYDETVGPLNEKQKKYVNNVLTSGKHLLLLINQILDMAKVEAGKMKLTLASLPVKALLNEISLLMADMVSKKKLQMILELADDLPKIEADELKVREILYNLLSNAVKFTPEGGKIGIRATKHPGEIEVVVWDTGIGIAPENMGKIFEGFFRVDTPYSRITEGTGLGLPLSRKLVELHGGKLSAESGGLNKGTSVRFTLPIAARKEV